jgi:Ca2+-binding RTX toxin-like protein
MMQFRTNARRLVTGGVAVGTFALLAAGVAVASDITGTQGSDNLRGTSAADQIDGRGGNDIIKGFGGDDVLLGGPGNDIMQGGGDLGEDLMFGGIGRDQAYGGKGRDGMYGGPGADTFVGGPGRDSGDVRGHDHVFLGAGRDYMTLLHNDGVSAFIDCGPGRDLVTYLFARDTRDRLVNCEVVRVENPGD